MSDHTEVTAENLRYVRGAKGMNQEEIAGILGIPMTAISNIENGRRSLSDSEKKLLDWYFFGVVPLHVVASMTDLKGVLEFDEAEWRMIGIMAHRDGNKTPGQWIASRIRDHIAPALAGEERQPVKYPTLRSLKAARVAEDEGNGHAAT